MPAKTTKRKTASSSSSASSSVGGAAKRMHAPDIVRAIERATRDHDALNKSMEKSVQAYAASASAVGETFAHTLRTADEDIEDRARHLAELDDQIAYQTRQGRIKVDQDLKEYGLAEARKLLTAHSMEPIHTDDLNQLRADLAAARQSHEEEVTRAVAEAIAKEKAIHGSVQARTKSEAQLELAQTKAQLESKDTIIESLRERVAKGDQDLSAQRELTRQIAESAAQGAITVNTTSGK